MRSIGRLAAAVVTVVVVVVGAAVPSVAQEARPGGVVTVEVVVPAYELPRSDSVLPRTGGPSVWLAALGAGALATGLTLVASRSDRRLVRR